jgi:hypothetical protein
MASPSTVSTSDAHTGQRVGMTKTGAAAGRSSGRLLTTSGMTSPARRTITVSPMRMSLRRTSSALCRVALVTVTPPTKTGSSRATGVRAPVRPTCTSMATTRVVATSARLVGNGPAGRERRGPAFHGRPGDRSYRPAIDLVGQGLPPRQQIGVVGRGSRRCHAPCAARD